MKEEFLSRLKAAIMPMHEETEKSGLLGALAEGTGSLEDYLSALKRLYGFVAPAEALMEHAIRAGSIPFEYESMKRLPHLVKDLSFFGMSQSDIEKLPLCDDLPPVERFDQALGILYLFEGSRVGGKILAKALRDKFHFKHGQGCSYFSSDESEIGARWNAFRKKVERYASAEGARQAIIASAQAGFRSLNRWLQSGSSLRETAPR